MIPGQVCTLPGRLWRSSGSRSALYGIFSVFSLLSFVLPSVLSETGIRFRLREPAPLRFVVGVGQELLPQLLMNLHLQMLMNIHLHLLLLMLMQQLLMLMQQLLMLMQQLLVDDGASSRASFAVYYVLLVLSFGLQGFPIRFRLQGFPIRFHLQGYRLLRRPPAKCA